MPLLYRSGYHGEVDNFPDVVIYGSGLRSSIGKLVGRAKTAFKKHAPGIKEKIRGAVKKHGRKILEKAKEKAKEQIKEHGAEYLQKGAKAASETIKKRVKNKKLQELAQSGIETLEKKGREKIEGMGKGAPRRRKGGRHYVRHF